ncbi:MAG: prephenate dehydratase [Cytophagaceae bacterium]|jgi:prephenate dehydratase|nr:prephenate dehydratase [Cytophagaceae bacterium]
MKVAIQGGPASFHHIAANLFFQQEPALLCCNSFKELCESLKDGQVDYAAMAIENSIAGSILNNYHLLLQYDLKIIGEIQLRIEQNLMALPGTQLQDVKIVRSHYMALAQCDEFFSQHSFTLEEYHDTADSARDLKRDCESRNKVIAAVASRKAASLYELEILAESIETVKENYTRFFILSNDKKIKIENSNKATLCFNLPNKVGALAEVLAIIVENKINLTKIQSLPLLGKPNQYTFYVDCEWNDYEDFKRSIRINSIVENLKILGEYKKGEMIHDYSSR